MKFRDYLINRRKWVVYDSESITATLDELADYLKGEPSNPDLSGVDFSETIEFDGVAFKTFTADTCDFNAGFSMSDCTIGGDFSLLTSYVKDHLVIERVIVRGDFWYLQNLTSLIEEDRDGDVVSIEDFRVIGHTFFTRV